MAFDPVFLSRLQFGFVITFHIIFPSFTIGLGAWLATIEGARLATGNPVYRRVFDFWLKVFALSFGMGVVTGIVMAFQFGTNWSVLAERTGPIQGPLLGYEAFTAFMLEATFFGVMLLGRDRVSPRVYFFVKSEGTLRTWAYARIPWLVGGVFVSLGLAFFVSITVDAGAIAQSNLRDRYWGLAFPILAVAALIGVVMGARARRDELPFPLTVLFFLASYVTLGVMFWPYMVPYAITVADAAAPDASLGFIFYGGVIVLPVIFLYSIGVYYIFRGKDRKGYG